MKIHVVSVNFLESWRCEIPRCEILELGLGVDLGVDFEVDLGVDLRVDLGN